MIHKARIRSGCKINLGLRLTGSRPNGYHELESIFYPLCQPCDDILIQSADGNDVSIDGMANIPLAQNIIFKACMAYAAATGYRPPISIRVSKRAPMGAGLGGGSANAAAMLAWLNENAPRPMPKADLIVLATEIGADAPFFLINKPCFVSGVGEKLQPMAFEGAGFFLIIACPDVKVSTAWAFQQYDRLHLAGLIPEKNLTNTASGASNSNSVAASLKASSLNYGNDLEQVVFPVYPELLGLKNKFFALGACHAAMSGSGSAIYGIFDSLDTARSAASILRQERLRVYSLPMRNFGM